MTALAIAISIEIRPHLYDDRGGFGRNAALMGSLTGSLLAYMTYMTYMTALI